MNHRVEVEAGDPAQPRSTRVEDRGEGRLVLSCPSDEHGASLRLPRGTAITVRWTTASGLHELEGVLLETVPGAPPCWVVEVREVDPVRQRRDAFRLDVHLPLALWCGPDRRVDGTVTDVSEGGIGFQVPASASLRRGDLVRASFPLDGHQVTLGARIVRLGRPAGDARAGGARFEAVEEELATLLRRYVLQEQIRRRSIART